MLYLNLKGAVLLSKQGRHRDTLEREGNRKSWLDPAVMAVTR